MAMKWQEFRAHTQPGMHREGCRTVNGGHNICKMNSKGGGVGFYSRSTIVDFSSTIYLVSQKK